MTWDSLRELRATGTKPALPLIVTSSETLPERFRNIGALVVFAKPGDAFPVELLAGLDVILMLDTCALASRVFNLADRKGVQFERLRAWCDCGSLLTVAPMSCESFATVNDWLEGSLNAQA